MIFGCASDEQFLDEQQECEELYTYCENHLAYHCSEIDICNPDKLYYPAMNQCREYLKNKDKKNGV